MILNLAIGFYIAFGILGAILLFVIFPLFGVGYIVACILYRMQWKKSDKCKFERGCSDPTIDFHLDMFNQGMDYRQKVIDNVKDVDIYNDGLHLFGEYYDFGYDKAVIILPGRMETCWYGAFYVEPYVKAGYNVLTIDPRAHGLSEGVYLTLGKKEADDALAWARYLHEKKHIKSIVLAGICVGCTTSCYAFSNPDCPSYINGFISDSMFVNFIKMYALHIKERKKPVFPCLQFLLHKIKKYNGIDPEEAACEKMVQNIKVPTLFFAGTKDSYISKEDANWLFDHLGTNNKKFVLLEGARHSHSRYDAKEMYDKNVIDFLNSLD